MKTICFDTLGCKINQYETAAMTALFTQGGFRAVEDPNSLADVYVVNTCAVTGTAEQKSRQAVRRATRRNPDAIVVVTGCYAQLSPDVVVGIPGVDVVFGTTGRERMVEVVEGVRESGRRVCLVQEFASSCAFEELPALFTTRTRAYLKIQEGCRDFCTYCVVPYARGPLRSRNPEAVLREAKSLLHIGFKELVLTGTHIGRYGVDLDPPVGLAELVARILCLAGIGRLRLSSIEPMEVKPELIELIASKSQFCPHLHIPLQSANDTILKGMGRRYTAEDYRVLVQVIRERIPDIALTTDVLVGFPGESDEAFQDTRAFVEEMGFSGLHVFKFSPRLGTPAATYPMQVPGPEKQRRLRNLRQVSNCLTHAFASRFRGHGVRVLMEKRNSVGLWEGFSDHYLPVVLAAKENLGGLIVLANVEAVENGLLTGSLL